MSREFPEREFRRQIASEDCWISRSGRQCQVAVSNVLDLRPQGAPVVPSFAYRFDATDRSIVISGHTAASQNLVKLAPGADVLVHSVMYPAAINRLVARVPNAAGLTTSILAHQTSAEDAGRMAQEAGVKTLVLSHFVPPDDPEVTDATWVEAARRRFRGTVYWAEIFSRCDRGYAAVANQLRKSSRTPSQSFAKRFRSTLLMFRLLLGTTADGATLDARQARQPVVARRC